MVSKSNIQLSVRAAAAALVSLLAAQLLQLEYPINAFIAAIIVTDLQPLVSRKLGFRRIVATVMGALCGAVMSFVLPPGPWGVGAGVFVAMLLAQLLKAGDGARVAGYICGIVLLDHSSEPWSYAFYRFIETVIGVLVAWFISSIPKLLDSDPPSDKTL